MKNDFIVRTKIERTPARRCAACRGIVDEGEVLRLGVEKGGKHAGARAQGIGQGASHEQARLRFHPFLPGCLRREHLAWGGSVGAVIHGQPGPVEQPFVANGGAGSDS